MVNIDKNGNKFRLRVGLLGGTFDPLHKGHIAIANYAITHDLVDEVWFVVSPKSPGKKNINMTDEMIRLSNVQLFVSNKPYFHCCDIEYFMPRPSFTYDTILALNQKYPSCHFFLILGADQWQHFDKWYKSSSILKEVGIIVFPRDNINFRNMPINKNVIFVHDAPSINISSTSLRQNKSQNNTELLDAKKNNLFKLI